MFYKIKGQGLIEMLVIVLFVGVSIAAILTFQNYLAYNTQLSQQRADATLLAVSQIETLKNFSSLDVAGTTSYANIANGSTSSTIGNTTYTVTWTITTTASPSYKNANVVVTWTDRNGGSQSVTLISNIAGIDPYLASTFM